MPLSLMLIITGTLRTTGSSEMLAKGYRKQPMKLASRSDASFVAGERGGIVCVVVAVYGLKPANCFFNGTTLVLGTFPATFSNHVVIRNLFEWSVDRADDDDRSRTVLVVAQRIAVAVAVGLA